MCMAPDVPPPPPPPQEAKAADPMQARRTKRPATPMGGGSLLTGPSGVAQGASNLGGATLLGG